MRISKGWFVKSSLMTMLAGTAILIGTSSPSVAQPGRGEERREERRAQQGGYWRHHDGRWDYWHPGDQRWYHTDGSHWYYNTNNGAGNAWKVYNFDRGFGRDGFERGQYQVPGPGAPMVLPTHNVYRPQ